MTPLTPVITAHWDVPDYFTLEGYKRHGGYRALPKALAMDPDAVIAQVKDTGLRGRGGAGFPTGLKWSFVPQNDGKPHYLVVNADESEPGACKDVPIMMANPHALLEGVIISSYAIRAHHAFIYIRGEVPQAIRRVAAAVREAEQAGLIVDNIQGSGYNLRVTVHSGAGAYICGEETALLDSLEGRRGQPRLKPPFPATHGLYAAPTVVNNVETIANIPWIVNNGVEWFRQFGTEKSPGFKVFAVSGHVNRPGIYEAPLGITMRELLDYAGGVRGGDGTVKFWIPGGSSVPMLTADHLDTPLTYEAMAEAGTMLGTGTPMVFN
ncbi:MAG: NADH-quinone oxidoreductase subunit NuoF, partial [Actinomycetota bacterium]